MAKPIPATDFVAKPCPVPAVCAVFGDDDFLRRQAMIALRDEVLSGDDAEMSLTRLDGRETELRDVLGELETIAMFGSGRRLVVVEQADDFVTRYRAELEKYVAKPVETGVLLLELKTFPASTRLYKAVLGTGMVIAASAPKGGQLVRWLTAWTRRNHDAEITAPAAEMLIELAGPELGLLDQEAARLAVCTGSDRRITPDLVKQHVGAWRARTAWEMLDAALDGQLPEAMRQLDLLLGAGEQPVGVLGQISYSLRQMAAATRLILQGETAGRKVPVPAALEQAGVRSFVIRKAETRLRRLGRKRCQRLYRWLLEADLDLKGASSIPPRIVLERLIVRLAAPANALERPAPGEPSFRGRP